MSNKSEVRLHPDMLGRLKESNGLRARVRTALGVSDPMMTRYIQANHENLTKYASLRAISSYVNLPIVELISNTEELKPAKPSVRETKKLRTKN